MAAQYEKGTFQDVGASPALQPPFSTAPQQEQFGGPPMYAQAPGGPSPPYPGAPMPGYAPPPPGYAPGQTQVYAMAVGPGGYSQVPGQPMYADQGYLGQPMYAQVSVPPGAYVQVAGAPSTVVTSQVVSMTTAPVQPVNNSLIVSSLVCSILACICGTLCCGLVPVFCALPALILSSIAMCAGPAMTPAAAERKNLLARIGLVLAIVALVSGTALVAIAVFKSENFSTTQNRFESSSSSSSSQSGQYCSSPKYTSDANDCTWQKDQSSYASYSASLSCCCKKGYGIRPDCYIDGIQWQRSSCLRCGPNYSG